MKIEKPNWPKAREKSRWRGVVESYLSKLIESNNDQEERIEALEDMHIVDNGRCIGHAPGDTPSLGSDKPQGSWVCQECGKDWGDADGLTYVCKDVFVCKDCAGNVTWHPAEAPDIRRIMSAVENPALDALQAEAPDTDKPSPVRKYLNAIETDKPDELKPCPLRPPNKKADWVCELVTELRTDINDLLRDRRHYGEWLEENRYTINARNTEIATLKADLAEVTKNCESLDESCNEWAKENKRLAKRDGNAHIELCYKDGDKNPFAREDLEIVDFGVSDNSYVVESKLLAERDEQIARYKEMERRVREWQREGFATSTYTYILDALNES